MAEKKKFSLAEQIRADVGEAGIASMDAAAVAGERTIENITSEILHYQAVGGDAVIQIGKRLIEAKEMLPHGGWLPWLSEQVNYSERTAQRLMKIARECSNPTALSDLGQTKALMLLTLPDEEQKNLLEAYDVPNMSTRELEDAIRERDEAKKRAEDAEKMMAQALADRTNAHNEMMETQIKLQDANAKIKELESAPKDLYKDEAAIKAAADEARKAAEAEWSARVKVAEDKLAKAEEKAKKAAEKAKTAGADASKEAAAELDEARQAQANAEAEAEQLRAELETAKREQAKASISGDADLAAFQLLFEQVQADVNKMRGLLLKVRGREDSDLGEKLAKALLALADKVKECAA